MSDTDIFRVNKQIERLDLIDEQWIHDTLSDDEIDEIHENDFNHLPDEEIENEEGFHDDDAWADLGLDRFINENQTTPLNLPSVSSPPS